MKTPTLLLLLAAVIPAASVAQQPTAQCNPTPWNNQVLLNYQAQPNDPRIQKIIGSVQDPSFDPQFYARLGAPTGVITQSNSMLLSFDSVQDPAEMAQRLNADAEIKAPFSSIYAYTPTCGTGPAQTLGLVEYENAGIKRFYISANGAEMNWLDNGGGGGGWVRTGQVWTTYAPGPQACSQPAYQPVYHFYSPQQNAHYYTANPAECGWLRSSNSGWNYTGVPFGAQRPQGSSQNCNGMTEALTPINVFFNRNDPNHRYSSNVLISESLRVQPGWVDQGVQLCVHTKTAP